MKTFLLGLVLVITGCNECNCSKSVVTEPRPVFNDEFKDTKRSQGLSGTIYSIEEIVQDELPEAPDLVKILWDKKHRDGTSVDVDGDFFVNFTDHHDGQFPEYRLGSKVKLYLQYVNYKRVHTLEVLQY